MARTSAAFLPPQYPLVNLCKAPMTFASPLLCRGSVTVGSMSTAVVVHSQPSQPLHSQSSQHLYQLWSFDRYLAATSSSRRLFWQRATEDKRWEVAAALSNMPERTEAVQEARQDFGSERWGLKPGGGGGGGAAELPDEDDVYL